MSRWLAALSFLTLVSNASDAAASKVAPDLTLARRGNPFLTTDGGRSVAVRFASPEAAAQATADLRSRGVTVATVPMVTGAYLATADGDALDVLARHPGVLRIEAAAPNLRPLDLDVVEGTGVGGAFRAALGASGHWLDGTGLTIADVDADVFVFHPSLFRANAGAFAWIDIDGNGVFEPGVDAIDLDRDGAAGPGEVARLLAMEMRSVTFARLEPSETFEATRDYVYLDTNGNQRRDFGDGFGEDTPAFGEPLFVPDDVNGNGKLDPGERLLRLGTTKLAKVHGFGQLYERGKAKGILAYGKKVLANLEAARAPEHGTYMTSIMAGGNGSNRYRGIAPGADLVVVTEPGLAALDWLAREPSITAVGMPIGSWFSPLDGSSELEGMVDALWKRGVFTSVSVGNNGRGRGHAVVDLEPGVETEIPIGGASTNAYVNVVTRAPGAALEIVLVDPEGATLSSSAAGETSARGTTTRMIGTPRVPASGKLSLRITMRGTTAPAPVHVFATGGFGEELRIERGASRTTTLGAPATADTSVGGTGWVVHSGKDYGATDPVGALASFSSRGPRIDGRNLVGLAGPVNPIAATIVKDAPEKMAVRAWAGTSCVSPQIAAAAALLKQHDPSLDAGAIRDKLLASARPEAGADPNVWGAGKLDVRAAIGLPPVSKAPPSITLELASGSSPRKLRVATTDGGARLHARWDFDYDGAWDTDWQPLAEVDAPEAGDVRVEVHDDAGNVVGAVLTVPPAPAVVEAPADRSDSGCTVATAPPSGSRRWVALLAIGLLWIARNRRRRSG